MEKRSTRVALALVTLAVLAYVIYALVTWFNAQSSQSDASAYSGDPIDSYEVHDYATVTQTNEEGIKVDEDDFIPVSRDGGPIFMDPIPESASDEEVEQIICDAARDLITHHSRENRAAMFEYMKDHSERITFTPLREAVDELTGYDFNNPTIDAVVVQCQ